MNNKETSIRDYMSKLEPFKTVSKEIWDQVVEELLLFPSNGKLTPFVKSEIRNAMKGLVKVNPYRGEGGRFASSNSGGGASPTATGGIAPGAAAKADKAASIAAEGKAKYTTAADVAAEKEAMGTATKEQSIQNAAKHDNNYQTAIQTTTDMGSLASQASTSNNRDAFQSEIGKFNAEAAVSFNLAGAWAAQAKSLGASDKDVMRRPRIGG